MSTVENNNKIASGDQEVNKVTEKINDLKLNGAEENTEPKRGERSSRNRSGRPFIPYEEQVAKIEAEQKAKEVVDTGVKGKVKWFSYRGKYGFIECDEKDRKDIFVHQIAISKSNVIKYYRRTLRSDEAVVFDVVKGKGGLEAANVTGPDGQNVLGKPMGFRRGPPRRPKKPVKNGAEKSVDGDAEKPESDELAKKQESGGTFPKKARRNNRRRNNKAENGGEPVEDGAQGAEAKETDADEPKRAKKPQKRRNNKKTGANDAPAAEKKEDAPPSNDAPAAAAN